MMENYQGDKKRLIVIVILLVFLGGCSTTGGTIGGLFPAPKITKGKINSDIYTSKDSDFSIAVPFKKDSSFYKYMEIKEQYSNVGAYISFAAPFGEVYRLEVAKKLDPEASTFDLKSIGVLVIENYSQQIEKGYKTKPIVIDKKVFEDKGHLKYYWKLSNSYHGENLYHYVFLQDFENMSAFIWIQTGHEDLYTQAMDYAKTFMVLN